MVAYRASKALLSLDEAAREARRCGSEHPGSPLAALHGAAKDQARRHSGLEKSGLTEKFPEMAEMLVRGLDVKEIARRLKIEGLDPLLDGKEEYNKKNSKWRHMKIVDFLYMYWLKSEKAMSCPQIGRATGFLPHSIANRFRAFEAEQERIAGQLRESKKWQ